MTSNGRTTTNSQTSEVGSGLGADGREVKQGNTTWQHAST